MSGNLTQATFQRALARMADLPEMDDGPLYLRLLHAGPPPPESSSWQVLGTVDGPQPWALHERERTPLELVIALELTVTLHSSGYCSSGFGDDETTSSDTLPCAASGGRWADLMAQIDDLIEEDQ